MQEEYPDEHWISAEGDEDDQDKEFEPHSWHDFYFRAFDALRYDRTFGSFGGESPITYLAMSHFAHDHGLTLNEFGEFRRLISIMDGIYLEAVAAAAKAAKAQQ